VFKNLTRIDIAGFEFSNAQMDELRSKWIVENVVGMVQVFVDKSPLLNEFCVDFGHSYPHNKMHNLRLMLLNHPKIRQWSSKLRFSVDDVTVIPRVSTNDLFRRLMLLSERA